MSRADIRVEDVLAGASALLLAASVLVGRIAMSARLTEDDVWAVCFLLFPLSLLVLAASVRYWLGGPDATGRPLGEIAGLARDWSPFVFFLLTYSAFYSRVFVSLFPVDRDPELLALDRALFGETPAFRLQDVVHPVLTDVMAVAYFLHVVLPPVLALLFYRDDRLRFRQFLLSVLLAGVIGTIGYTLVPAVGPSLAFPESFHVPLVGALYGPLTQTLDLARAPRDVFPSLHVGVSAVVLWHGFRRGRVTFWVLLLPVTLNWVSTIYLRYHYLVDVFAGWATAAAACALAAGLIGLERRWRGPGDDGPRAPA